MHNDSHFIIASAMKLLLASIRAPKAASTNQRLNKQMQQTECNTTSSHYNSSRPSSSTTCSASPRFDLLLPLQANHVEELAAGLRF
jgi:hypothetical protein